MTKRRTVTRLGIEVPEAFFLLIKIRTVHIDQEMKKNCEENAHVKNMIF